MRKTLENLDMQGASLSAFFAGIVVMSGRQALIGSDGNDSRQSVEPQFLLVWFRFMNFGSVPGTVVPGSKNNGPNWFEPLN